VTAEERERALVEVTRRIDRLEAAVRVLAESVAAVQQQVKTGRPLPRHGGSVRPRR
jgi:hypothetical protein